MRQPLYLGRYYVIYIFFTNPPLGRNVGLCWQVLRARFLSGGGGGGDEAGGGERPLPPPPLAGTGQGEEEEEKEEAAEVQQPTQRQQQQQHPAPVQEEEEGAGELEVQNQEDLLQAEGERGDTKGHPQGEAPILLGDRTGRFLTQDQDVPQCPRPGGDVRGMEMESRGI